MMSFIQYFVLLATFASTFSRNQRSHRDKRQIPGLGGLGSFGAIPGLGSLSGLGGNTGSGIASIPGLTSPTIIQPAANKPCPVALVPQQFGGGLKFGNPFNFGMNLKGQDAEKGAWGTGFDTSFGNEMGGSIFGDAGHKAVPIECRNPTGNPPSGASSGGSSSTGSGGGSLPVSSNNPIAKVLAENPDLLRQALEQNPDLLKGVSNRKQVQSALENDPELIRQALIDNPNLIQGAIAQAGANRQSQTPPSPPQPADPALQNAVIRKLIKDSNIMRQFVGEHGYSIRVGLKQSGLTRTLSDGELMQLLASNPAILDQIFDASPALVAQTASKYRIAQDWDALPTQQKWGASQAAVFAAFGKDPFFMEQVFIEEPLYLMAAMRKGKFDVGDLSDDQIRQVLYDHPEYVRAMLARDSVFTKHIRKEYGVVAGKEYIRTKPSRAEMAFMYLSRSDTLMEKVFRENPTDVKRAVAKQKVNPDSVTTDQIIASYKKRPEMLKLMLLQNPEFVTTTMKTFRAMQANGGLDAKPKDVDGFSRQFEGNVDEETTVSTPRVKIRTGRINPQIMQDTVKPGFG